MKNFGQITLLVAAAMISGAVLFGAQSVSKLLERQNDEVALLRLTVAQLQQKLDQVPDSQQTRRTQVEEQVRSNELIRHSVNTAGAPQLGPDDAEITIVEFSDFECPYCRKVLPAINQIRDEYQDAVRVLFLHYPLSIHPNSMGAHIAAEAAHRQGKFWEMHDRIFSNPTELFPQAYELYATEIGLDLEVFKRDLLSPNVRARVQQDITEAKKLGVSGTPGFFINGLFVSGARSFGSFKQIVDRELAGN